MKSFLKKLPPDYTFDSNSDLSILQIINNFSLRMFDDMFDRMFDTMYRVRNKEVNNAYCYVNTVRNNNIFSNFRRKRKFIRELNPIGKSRVNSEHG